MSASTSADAVSTPHRYSLATLTVGAIGVVYGDIGTSPLYAMKETFAGPHPLPIDEIHVFGVLSLIFWSITIVVSLKYVIVMMRADNRGEGGTLALLALLNQVVSHNPRLITLVSTLGIFAAALFYGDSMITPAISVLSAVEGLNVVAPQLEQFVVPMTILILLGLFLIQKRGTAAVGVLFGPIMVAWFVLLGFLGVTNILHNPHVLLALSPHYAVKFFLAEKFTAFLALGSVVLVVTGAEALYADMGHFGRWPIRLAWYGLVWPALVLNYFGQGALLLAHPEAIENPFIRLAPAWAGYPMVGLATCATVIASQAVISGAFSVTRQAIQLGYLPRMNIVHTSEREIGQIYLPFLNWMLAAFVVTLVLGFRSSSNLAAAYGIAVTGTMLITSVLVGLVMFLIWGWKGRRTTILVALFMIVDATFLLANSAKIVEGGWFPLAVGLGIFMLLTTWKRGRGLLLARIRADAMPVDTFLAALSDRVIRVPGTAIFLSGAADGVPAALLHNMKHNKVVHERVILLNVRIEDRPFVPQEDRIEAIDLGQGFRRLKLRYGFMQDPNIPRALANAKMDQLGFFYEPMTISYFLGRETIIPSAKPGMSIWREALFAWMARSATTAMVFFHLPVNRVVELGEQIEI